MNSNPGSGVVSGMIAHQPYPSDVSDPEWDFVLPYLCLLPEDACQREHGLRDVFDAPRWIVRTGAQWRYLPRDFPPWQAVYQQARRWLAAGCFEAIVHDLRAVLRFAAGRDPEPTAAILDGRTIQSTPESGALAEAVQEATGDSVELAYVDQGYTGEEPSDEAAGRGIILDVVKLPEAKRGFVLLPRRWVAERSFAWAARFRRLARDYERLSEMLAGLHYVAFSLLMLQKAAPLFVWSS